MAAPTVNAVTTAFAASQGANVTLNVPSHTNGSSYLWSLIASGAGTRQTPMPTGWTLNGSWYVGTSSAVTWSLSAWYRLASSEPASYTLTPPDAFTDTWAAMLAIDGAENPATTAPVVVTDSNGASGTATRASITPTDADSLLVWFALDRQSITGVTPGSGYTEQFEFNGRIGALWGGTRTQGASATGTETFSYTPTFHASPAWAHMVLALAPAGGGGSASPYYYNLQQAG